ncbi:EamA family transporter [Imtechella halotolerans]|uniref:EamA domain-containing protein n=1 Tax=Imtechella halotolerans K1 TaxID=946077 RepID=I0WFQ0_9FLAO|nr:EamA family transporter [Imtechella halotolerans]EID75216.1 hypothetical protein W5A_06590 [Imtechella halotolerans K1]WMQ63854.1 EamA family transporter [Imtechella halotolerans]
MLFLLLSIVFSTVLFVIFKIFKHFEINILHAIIANYFTAASLGFIFAGNTIPITSLPQQDWFPWSVMLGLLFISVFNLLGITTQKSGVSVASVVSKMSLVIPVILAFILYNEQITLIKSIGIILALSAVYLTSKKENGSLDSSKTNWLFPLLLFIGAGTLDALLKYINLHFVDASEMDIFSANTFLSAGCYGVLFLLITYIRKKFTLKPKSIIAGVCLGIPNYFSLYYLLKALDIQGLESSVVFPVNNVGVVISSTLIGLIAFKETTSLRNWIGIIFAIIAILLMTLF